KICLAYRLPQPRAQPPSHVDAAKSWDTHEIRSPVALQIPLSWSSAPGAANHRANTQSRRILPASLAPRCCPEPAVDLRRVAQDQWAVSRPLGVAVLHAEYQQASASNTKLPGALQSAHQR